MPIRGENIGSAYVRIFADGSGMDQSIRDAFNDSEPSVREGAQSHGKTYDEEFARSMRRNYKGAFGKSFSDIIKETNDEMTRQMSRLEFSDRFFRSSGWQGFRKRLVAEGGPAGELLAKSIADQFRDSGNLDRLPDAIRTLGPDLRRAQRDIIGMLQEDALRMNADFDRRAREMQNMGRVQSGAIMMNLRRDLDGYLDQLQAVERGERSGVRSRRQLVLDFQRISDAVERSHVSFRDLNVDVDDVHRRLLRAHPTLLAFNRTLDSAASRSGRFFGRGSRNNFINFFGGITEGAVRLGLLIPKTIGRVAAVVGDMRTGFDAARIAGNGLFSSLVSGGRAGAASLAAMIETGPIGILALAGAFLAATIAIGPLISLLAVLAGGVVALAGSAFFALASGVTALVAAILPLGGILLGAGAAVFYFMENSDRLQKQLKPLVGGLEDLRDAAGRPIFDAILSKTGELRGVLERLEPLFAAVGRGVSGMIRDLVNGLDSPGFNGFIAQMTDFLPQAMRSLNRSIINTFGGLGGIFTAMLPEVNRFLDWLEKITGEFQEWANSREGRGEILNFFTKARESAKAWGDMLGNVIELFATLFDFGGKDAGDTLVGDISASIQEFTDYLRANPHAVEEWFGDVVDVLRDLGRVTEAIAHLFDAIDTPTNRTILSAVFSQMTVFLNIVAGAARLAERAIEAVFRVVGRLADIRLPRIDLSSMFSGLGGGGGVGGMPTRIISGFSNLGPRILKAIGNINISRIVNLPGVNFLTGPFVGLAAKALNRAGRMRLADMITDLSSISGTIVGKFAGLANRIFSRSGKWDLADMIRDLSSIAGTVVGKFAGLAGRIFGAIGRVSLFQIFDFPSLGDIAGRFSGLAGSILGQIGRIDLGSLMHGSIDPPGPLGPWSWASGGVARSETIRRIGEAGPEAVVPLSRPLGQVDPSVRLLSAFAQGQLTPSMAAGGVVGSGKTINLTQNIYTPVTDPRAVAVEAFDYLAGVGY